MKLSPTNLQQLMSANETIFSEWVHSYRHIYTNWARPTVSLLERRLWEQKFIQHFVGHLATPSAQLFRAGKVNK